MKKTLLTFKTLVITIMVTAFPLNSIFGQVATLQNWTNVYHGTSQNQLNLTYPVPSGSNANRVLVVAVSASKVTTGQITVTMSYGGKTLTLANGDMGTTTVKQHTALYYLNEAGLDAATSSTLSATVSAGGATMVNTDIWAAVFDYVNQTSPLTNTQTYSSGTGQIQTFSFGTALTINAYNQAVEVVNSYNPQQNTIRTIDYATNWTMISDSTALYKSGFSGASIRNGVANRSIPNINTSDVSSTSFNNLALASMTALSLNYETPPPPTIQTSNISFSDVTTSSFTINWTSGNGTNRIVLVKAGSAVDSDPVNGTGYTASDLFGSGSQIGTGNYVVYNGTGYNVTVFNLDANTTYHVAVYEFSGPPGMEHYLTDPARGSQLTDPETAITDDYRSIGSGNWSDAGIWQTFDGSSWVTAGSPPNSSSGVISIRNGHSITVAGAVTVDQVVIETGAQITVNSGITWTIADGADAVDCNVDGTLNNGGTITTTGVLSFNNGSVYNHDLDGGTIPTATWDASSLCLVTGITDTAPSGFGQSFGNFTWNCESQTLTVAMNNDATVKGNFRLTSTGSGKLALIDSNNSKSLTVLGQYIQTGGTFDFNNGSSSSAIAYLNVAGNFYFSGGTLTESSSGRGSVVFNGSSQMQTYTSGGTISNTIDFTVNNGAYLQMGKGSSPSYISGSNGTFTLSTGATLGITDFYGITFTSGPQGGNIRVSGTRNFDTGANYIYNGSGNQYTGNGLPLTVNRLILNNSGGIVIFDAARTISSFSITAGSKTRLGTFTHLTSSLSLGGVGQQSGTYGHSSSPATNINDTYFDAATGIVNNQPPSGTWIGATSTDWNTASNWIGGVPTTGTDAIIPSGPMYYPIVLNTPLAECNNLTIESGASLTIIAGQALTVHSNLNNSGTLNLKSDASGTASLILDSYTDNGTENIELFLTGGEAGAGAYRWHYISSPVSPSIPASIFEAHTQDLAQFIEGNYTGTTEEGWIASDGYIYATGSYGQRFYDLILGRGYDYYSGSDHTFTFDGALNTSGLDNIQLDYSGAEPGSENYGFNLLGNPFTSGLSWDLIVNLPDYPLNTSKSVFFTKDNIQYTYVNGVGTPEGANGHIPPMQGFFVKTSGTGNAFKIPLSAREHNSTPRYKGSDGSISLIRLSLTGNGKSDETVVRFDNNAKEGIDYDFDAVKLNIRSGSPSITSMAGKTGMIINGIPFPETSVEIPLCITPGNASGKLTISVRQIEGLEDYIVLLTDKSVNKTINLRTTPAYSLDVPEGPESGRFVLTVKKNAEGEDMTAIREDQFMIYNAMDLINIKTVSEEWEGLSGTVKLLSITGRPLSINRNRIFSKDSLIQIEEPDRPGIYLVEISSGQKRFTGKVVVK